MSKTVTTTVETTGADYDFKSKTNMYAAITYVGTQIDYAKALLEAYPNISLGAPLLTFIKQYKTIGVNGPRGYGFTRLAKGLSKAYKGTILTKNWYDARKLVTQGYVARTIANYSAGNKIDSDFIIVDDAGTIPVEQLNQMMEVNGAEKFYILLH
jgi:hypothetical protein